MQIQFLEPKNPLWSEVLRETGHDVYQLPEYTFLEAERIGASAEAALVQGEGFLFVPYLVRRWKDVTGEGTRSDALDITSAYGYPGFLLDADEPHSKGFEQEAWTELSRAWSERQICSAFIRLHPLLNTRPTSGPVADAVHAGGSTVWIDLTVDLDDIWRNFRPDHRNRIRRCSRNGFVARMVPPSSHLGDFNQVYEETMSRVGAERTYYFGEAFLSRLAMALGDRLHLCLVERGNDIACAGLFFECDGIVQYHLSGTRSEHFRHAPTTLMLDFVSRWARERGNRQLHLGGGIGGSARDSLFEFKAGFSNQRSAFDTIRLVTNPECYRELVEERAKQLCVEPPVLLESNYFPAYRSGGGP